MSFSFHEEFPAGLKLNIDPGIFHDPKHLNLQASSGWHSFYILKDNCVEGIFHAHIKGVEATSPYRSPFGSFLFSENVTPEVRSEFIKFCENKLKQQNIKNFVVKNPPEGYSKKNILTEELLKAGYTIKTEETSAIIAVSEKPFNAGLHKSERKRLRKCRESALQFEHVELTQLQKVYMFLEACREEKGYSLSMTFDAIQELATVFPERIMLTVVADHQKIAAANISIRVYNHVLYNFYHDHSGEYDHLSPVVLLNEGLYSFCQHKNIKLLDLGTSNLNGKLNESLLNFKINLGAQLFRKLTFEKHL